MPPKGWKKDKSGDKQGWKESNEPTTQRITTMDGHGSTSMEVAPAAEPLAPLAIPEGDEAVRVLTQLAEQNARVASARKRFEESQATTKARRSTWETEAKRLEVMLTEATTAKPLPLFDADQSERDLRAMESAAAVIDRSESLNGFQEAINDGVLEGSTEAAGEAQETSGTEEPTLASAPEIVAPEPIVAAPEATADVF